MEKDLLYKSAVELRDLIAAKEISPVELLDRSLARLEEVEPKLNSFVTTTEDVAYAAARKAEKAILDNDAPGLLHGLPISVKDLIAMDGVRYTFGSRVSADNIAAVDAPAVERVRREGGVIIGKTTTSEFGCKAVGDSPLTGITRNPWDVSKTPGGSSAGAAASVASGVTPFALGTDGGGSVRIPGSLTGLFAVKAQFARVPVFPEAATPTLAHVGPMARTVRDAALLLTAVAGFDRRDPFAVAEPVPDFLAACDQPVKGMRIAWSPTLGYANPTSEVVGLCEQAVRTFEELGCEVELVDKVMESDPIDMWMSEFYAGVGTRLKTMFAGQTERLDPAVAEMLSGALDRTLEEYWTQVFNRYRFREEMRQFMERYDLLVSPVLPVPAFDVGLNVPPQIPDANVISWVRYTYPFNLTGQPGASLPVGFTGEGLPVGLQLISKTIRETDIFRVSAAFEAARPWSDKKPPMV
jgi:Asp-tRNA(Asn)/Glu-tRNA(Gln) amidotransferase A subunit family amidase